MAAASIRMPNLMRASMDRYRQLMEAPGTMFVSFDHTLEIAWAFDGEWRSVEEQEH